MFTFKKSILLLLFLAISLIVSGTTYYVSNAGNDASNGLSVSASWRTIAKVNSFSFAAGDIILFNKGDTWYETLTVSSTGTNSHVITFGAYGSGNAPVISGFTTLTGWTNYGGGIYSKAISVQSTPNIVLLDGVNTPLGRTPNLSFTRGWPSNTPTVTSPSSTSVTCSGLQTSPSLVGADIVIRTAEWITERRTITSHSGNTVGYAATQYTPPAGAGCFIENDISCLDVYGEWCYRSGTIYMYFGNDNPTNHTIKISTRNNVITCSKNYMTFDGLVIEGGNTSSISLSGASYNTIQNSTIRYGGDFGIYGASSNYLTVTTSTIDNNNNSAITLGSECTNYRISYNTISNSGMIPGMGQSSDNDYNAIVAPGNYGLISHNNILNQGYDGIRWGGQATTISYNFINHSCQNKADGGGMYSYRDMNTAKVVDHNIVLNSMLQFYGWPTASTSRGSSHGIYCDGACNISITNNIIANCGGQGIFVNADQNITAQYNTIYNCNQSIYVYSEPGRAASNHVIRYNTLVAKTTAHVSPNNSFGQFCMYLASDISEADLHTFGTIDYNYYAFPIMNPASNYIFWYYYGGTYGDNSPGENIAQFYSALGYEQHATISSKTVSDTSQIHLVYNATTANKLFPLDAGYVDAQGTKYSGTITLLPYTALVLMVDPNPSAPPSSPVYVNSTVEDATPTLIEIDYSSTLANVLSNVNAFSVRVNSVSQNVESVVISGTSVILTLANEVTYGDVVTVAYTKPATNALVSASGIQVATMSAQSVTNKVNPVGPIYISSSIENSTPKILEINYDEILDNSVPDTSAFIVMVNGVRRIITSVAITGNKVFLTMAIPVVYDDNVTVSYLKPSNNQLKKATGELAVSFSSPQPVTNNCLSLANNSAKKSTMTIYPNPAQDYINVSFQEQKISLESQILRIFDLSGKLCLESILNSGNNNYHVFINLKSDIYIVQIVSGSIINFVQKLIVN
jgi:uncharacterized repeat protein (TIGR02059 family)